MKKYELVLDMTKEVFGVKLFRIRALVSFGTVIKGELGGWIEKEANLDAQVCGNAWVYGDARVYGNAWVYGDARVSKFHQIKHITNLKWSFTSLPKGIQVGCMFFKLSEWRKNHLAIGKKEGMSEELSKAYYQLMLAVRKVQSIESKEEKRKK